MTKSDSIKLDMLGLPVIQSLYDFSIYSHISKRTIYQLSIRSDYYYKIYQIPKKSGKLRTISQPSKKLKGLQSWILRNILDLIKVSNSCKGFEKKRSTFDNATPHIGASTILTIDLMDFFPSISSKYVYNIFKTIGYNSLISTVFTNICTYKSELPQGSPCSPKLANLATWNLDKRIQGYIGKRGLTYTRYADDLTFSGLHPTKVVKIIPTIKSIIESEGFRINNLKTRVAGITRRKVVTGLVVTDEKVGIGKQKYKLLRSKIHHLTLSTENKKLLNEVKGWISYLNSVDKSRFTKATNYIKKLSNEYPNSLIVKLLKLDNRNKTK